MTIGPKTPLATVAVLVGDALRRYGIRAVLTGGACASLHSGGVYVSRDVDYVLPSGTLPAQVDAAMRSIGFRRDRDRYLHADSKFFVEFPRGPLAIGARHRPRPVRVHRGSASAWALSATDSCLDRLAAFYHWQDRQARAVALQIAVRNRVLIGRMREWSRAEDAASAFEEFEGELRRERRRRRR